MHSESGKDIATLKKIVATFEKDLNKNLVKRVLLEIV